MTVATSGSMPAGTILAGIRRMLAISWGADRARSVAAGLTATGQYAVMPLRALGLATMVDGIADADRSGAMVGIALLVGASAANRLMAWASLNVRMRLREHTQRHLDSHLMALTAGLPGIEHHELPEYLDAVERLRAERPYLANPFNPISWSVASIVQALTVVVLLGRVSPVLCLLPVLGIPAAIAAARAENDDIRLADDQAEGHRVLRHLYDLATDPGPAKEVRIYGLRDEVLARRGDLFSELEAARQEQARRHVATQVGWWVLFAAGYAASLGLTVDAARDGRIGIGAVVLVLTLGAQLNAQLAELAYNVAWFTRCLRAVRRLVWFSDYAEDVRSTFAVPDPSTVPAVLGMGIELRGVTFAYPGSTRPVLRDLDLRLPAGSTVALVGENGSGKTTLVKLLLRMYEPTEGAVLADGVDIRRFDVDEWRRSTSAGFQDFARFEFVARDSIGTGDVHEDRSDGELVDALHRAVAADVVRALPDGLDTQLGRQFDGVDLSGGQWQKVALGRALLRSAPLLLVLDEPTASLDASTEHALFEQFAHAAHGAARESGGVTLLVSHRFSTVRMADLIVVLVGGRITEVGTHEELLREAGTYAELYQLQARSYRPDRG